MKSGKTGINTTITNMKYLEELSIGECFIYNKDYLIVTSDFKKNNSKFCINLTTGYGKWISPNEEVDQIDIFTLDKDSNILAIRERQKDQNNAIQQNTP